MFLFEAKLIEFNDILHSQSSLVAKQHYNYILYTPNIFMNTCSIRIEYFTDIDVGFSNVPLLHQYRAYLPSSENFEVKCC